MQGRTWRTNWRLGWCMCPFLAVAGEWVCGKNHAFYILSSLYVSSNACHWVCVYVLNKWKDDKMNDWKSLPLPVDIGSEFGTGLTMKLKPLADPATGVEKEGEGMGLRWIVPFCRTPEEFYCRFLSFNSCDSMLPSCHHPSPSVITALPRGNTASHQGHKNPCGSLWISSLLSHEPLLNCETSNGSLLLFEIVPQRVLHQLSNGEPLLGSINCCLQSPTNLSFR